MKDILLQGPWFEQIEREYQVKALMYINNGMFGSERWTREEAEQYVDNRSHGPKLAQVMPACLWPDNTWYWLPPEDEDDA